MAIGKNLVRPKGSRVRSAPQAWHREGVVKASAAEEPRRVIGWAAWQRKASATISRMRCLKGQHSLRACSAGDGRDVVANRKLVTR